MAGFRTPVDIANRALQIVRRPPVRTFNDPSVSSVALDLAYDSLRLGELRRACWRFSTRRIVLRAITTTSQFVSPPAWSSATAYVVGDIVTQGNQTWVAMVANTGNAPGTVPTSGVLYWDTYFGSLVADVWNSPIEPQGDSSAEGNVFPTSYWTNELVFTTPGDGTYTVYRSLINNNTYDPAGVDSWINTTVYTAGQVVVFDGTNYQSLIALNFNNEPATSPSQWTTTITSPLVSNSWRVVTSATIAPLNIVYPLGAGPANDSRTRNAFHLPNGFLRQAPTDPKAGINPFLGAPTGNMQVDWVFEGNFIVSQNANPIMLRFVADIQSVPNFDQLFALGLATRLAIELAPLLAGAEEMATIISVAREEYARTIQEARTINGIETGPVDPYEDDYITARL